MINEVFPLVGVYFPSKISLIIDNVTVTQQRQENKTQQGGWGCTRIWGGTKLGQLTPTDESNIL